MKRRFRFRRAIVSSLGLGLGLLAPSVTAQDALSRAEFDTEVSVEMKVADIVDVFRLMAKMSGVPFVLEFETEPPLRVSLRASNMVLRGVLASLASSHGLSYSAADSGIVVRRRGEPPAAEGLRLGDWPPQPGSPYALSFDVRDASGDLVSQPRLTVALGLVGVLRLGLAGDGQVTVLDRERSILEREYVAGLELAVCPKRRAEDGLDLLVEVISRTVESESRFVESHQSLRVALAEATRTTPIATTPDGHVIRLTSWSLASPSPTP